MTEIDIIRIILSFFVGGAAVTGFTVLTEKLGSRIGGLISGVPTTIAVALFFQSLLLGTQVVNISAGPVIATVGIFGAFCSGYIYFSRYNVFAGLLGGCTVWFLFVTPLALFPLDHYFFYLGIYVLLAPFFIFLMTKIKMNKPEVKLPRKIPLWAYALRFCFSGGVISTAVILSLIGDEIMGGIFAAFPAMAISSIVVLTMTMGRPFTQPYIQTTYRSSVINCAVYVTAIYFLYPLCGIYLGTALAFICVFGTTFMLLNYKKHKLTRA